MHNKNYKGAIIFEGELFCSPQTKRINVGVKTILPWPQASNYILILSSNLCKIE